jgi:hypothetical protein
MQGQDETQSAAKVGRSGVFCCFYLVRANAIESLGYSKNPVQCFGAFATKHCNVSV